MSTPVRTLLIIASSLIWAGSITAEDAPTATEGGGGTSSKPAWLSLVGSVGAGWDSNILLEPAVNPTSSDISGAGLSADLKVGFRVLNRPEVGQRITLSVDGGIAVYPDNHEADLGRFGGAISGTAKLGGFDPGIYAGAHRYWLDGETVANTYGLNPYLAKIWTNHVGVLTLGANWLDYPEEEDRSGLLASLEYRHWFLLAPRVVTRRIEVGLRGVDYSADSDVESFVGVVPFAGALYRIGQGQRLGTVDVAGRVSYEWRNYSDADDTQGITTLAASADLWVCRVTAVGLYVVYTDRTSDLVANEYDRTQVGARATVQW